MILTGSALEMLQLLPDESVQCAVTSPPYWGLRDYGLPPQVWDGDPDCVHDWGRPVANERRAYRSDSVEIIGSSDGHVGRGLRTATPITHFCRRCGAWRGSLGLEPTPQLYVDHLVSIFHELHRVLRSNGTFWLVLGDSYTSGGRSTYKSGASDNKGHQVQDDMLRPSTPPGLKPKDLVGIPWRVAFALQAHGWWLRRPIIWNKPNPIPESARDRPTRSYEYIFLLTKSAHYYYDWLAIAEPLARPDEATRKTPAKFGGADKYHQAGKQSRLHSGNKYTGTPTGMRNARSVWTIPAQPFRGEFCLSCRRYYPNGKPKLYTTDPVTGERIRVCECGANQWMSHFAAFPSRLASTCIKAGTSAHGCCPTCGAPWKRVIESHTVNSSNAAKAGTKITGKGHVSDQVREDHDVRNGPTSISNTVGWRPTCVCGAPAGFNDVGLEVIGSPLCRDKKRDDPSLEVGRAGYSRPRRDGEGVYRISRQVQAEYANQLKTSPHREEMKSEAGDAFAHYVRTDKSGARAIPKLLLEKWLRRGWLTEVDVPIWTPAEPVPCTVLDPFSGAGTTGLAAHALGRDFLGIELNPDYVEMSECRLQLAAQAQTEKV